ncbi:MAG: hypothetical protein HYX68_07665 [Planctomycetes bacterium]|nr:hypothetical protein [Planctomycetota bacterium]
MATVTQPKTFNHEESQRRVRHPLQLLRKYIRRYVILEGLALTILAASILFWLGLALDFGLTLIHIDLVNIHGLDWLLELDDVDPSLASSRVCRIMVLAVISLGLAYLAVTRVVVRWLRDFNDQALALVLERRFKKELGDRLITAVELADPKLSKRYGYSQAMVEKTIGEAVETLKKLPVSSVFNWSRLFVLWFLVGVVTIGLFIVNLVVISGGSYVVAEQGINPYRYCWNFYHVASIWTERNLLIQASYWPRNAHLEIEGFQRSKTDANDMRVPRDDPGGRPDLQIRAVEWVIADPKAPYGWRPLRWKDLSEEKLIEPALLDRVKIPADFADWKIDADKLEPNLVAALFENVPPGKTSGKVRAHFERPEIKAKIDQREAQTELDEWLDWRTWMIDEIDRQRTDPDVRVALQLDNFQALDEIFTKLDELRDSPSMGRTLRKLAVPSRVDVVFRGEESGRSESIDKPNANKFTISLRELKDSTKFNFRARGEDFFTPKKSITLVGAPAPKGITIDKDEPAYIYHRLIGPDQTPLRGQKHLTRDLPLSFTGDTNTIDVALGSKLAVHVRIDRPLRKDRAVFTRDPPVLPEGYLGFQGKVSADADQGGFTIEMDKISRRHDFTVEFIDEDNIRGRRRFKILSILDGEPQVSNLSVHGVLLRKAKFRAPEPAAKDAGNPRDQADLTGAFLITPVARIPFECIVKDDYGLVKVGYQHRYRKVDFELIATGGAKKLPRLEVDKNVVRYRSGLVLSNLQFWPGNPISWHFGNYHVAITSDILQEHLRQSQGFEDGYADAVEFQKDLQNRVENGEMITLDQLQKALTARRVARGWEFDFKDRREAFDVKEVLPALRAVDPDKIGQMHYHLQIAVQATDNNVETGPGYRGPTGKTLRGTTKKNPNGFINFLVISENELLAQIALEEETLLEKLQSAKEKVDASIVSLLEQQSKVRDPKTDMETVLHRMNEIRTALSLAGNNLRDTNNAYQNILREMQVNRIRADRMETIEKRVIQPLTDIVMQNSFDDPKNPVTGTHPRAEELFDLARQQVERDASAQQPPDADAHQKAMSAAQRQMSVLSNDIKRLLDALEEGVVESKLIALLASIEQRQRERTRFLDEERLRIIREEIEKLLGKDKKDEKKPEPKKTSQLRDPRSRGAIPVSWQSVPERSRISAPPSWRRPGRSGFPA